jgi:hypothetical protein
MKRMLFTAVCLAAAAGGVALAQNAPAPSTPGAVPPPAAFASPPPDGPGGRGGPHRPGFWHHMPPGEHGFMAPSRAASFRFRRGDAMVDVKCAETETTKACVDAAGAMLDKLKAAQP